MDNLRNSNEEYAYHGTVISGFAMMAIVLFILPALAVLGAQFTEGPWPVLIIAACVVLWIIMLCGFFIQQPNQARVMIFFGKYRGTVRETGFFWVNPFMTARKISLRLRNMDVEPIKVNDKVGNPVMIGMVLVWKVRNTYRAIFDVDTPASVVGANTIQFSANHGAALETFVRIQSDAALREVTGRFAYDNIDGVHDEITLRGGGEEINDLLEHKINERLAMAGIEVVEAHLNYLAYAPEIAAVMLRRQQAAAIISAREKIVEGAVSMVKMALSQLQEENVVQLDKERKAAMVSNMLVVLCADEPARSRAEGVLKLSVRNALGEMVPFSSFMTVEPSLGQSGVSRYNMYPTASLTATPAHGVSSSEGIKIMEDIVESTLGTEYSYAWTGEAFQESQGGVTVSLVLIFAVVITLLVLAAQYESLTDPVAVVISMPTAILGTVIGCLFMGQSISIYTQIGIILLLGLSAKNAILIVEYAIDYRRSGMDIRSSATQAGRVRFRPIMMTALAFVFGVMPMLFATGAGAASRVSLGTAVVFGMAVNALVGTLFVPNFWELLERFRERRLSRFLSTPTTALPPVTSHGDGDSSGSDADAGKPSGSSSL